MYTVYFHIFQSPSALYLSLSRSAFLLPYCKVFGIHCAPFSGWYSPPQIFFPFIISHIWSYGEHLHYRGWGDKHQNNWGKKMFLCCQSYILWKICFPFYTKNLFTDTNGGESPLRFGNFCWQALYRVHKWPVILIHTFFFLNKSSCFFDKCNVKSQLWLKC